MVSIAKSRSSARSVLAAALVTALAASFTACGGSSNSPVGVTLAESATAQLTILGTTDLHANVVSYDYFKLADDSSLGLERTATLIK